MCRQGASVIQTTVLDAAKDLTLRVYVTWVPILPTDQGGPDNDTLSLVPDERAAHYWDAERVLPNLFRDVLQLPEGYPAWDVYMIYEPGATWEDNPPQPAYWQHQLPDVTNAPSLDGGTFAKNLRRIMGGAP